MPPVTTRRPAAPAAQKVKFLDMGAYAGGNFDLPEGRYALFFDFCFHAYTKQDGSKGTEFLATHIEAYPLDTPGAEPFHHYLSLGRKAKDSVMPNADDNGKSLVLLPGATGGLSRNTNSHLFFRSMLDAGMPPELADVDDLTQIDGVWVLTKNVLEPEERKGYGKSGTGEVEEQQRNQNPQKIPTVIEILEGGEPWNNGGGLPEAAPAPKAPARAAAKPAAAAARPAAARRPAAPVVEEEAEEEAAPADEGMTEAVRDALGAVLALPKNAKGMTRLALRMDAFKEIKKSAGEDGQQALAAMFEESPDVVETLLGELGYSINGPQVKPAK